MLTDDEGAEVARAPFYLRDPHARLALASDKRSYEQGEPIELSWSNGPANRWDWLGVYKASASDPADDDYLVWAYSAGHAAGTVPPTTDGEATLGPRARAPRGRCRRATTSSTICSPTSTSPPGAWSSAFAAAGTRSARAGRLAGVAVATRQP